eukprot:14148809-Alexandrium_andersonii.AAC.1
MASSCPKHLSTIGPFRSGSASPGCGVIQLSASTRKAAARQCARGAPLGRAPSARPVNEVHLVEQLQRASPSRQPL